MNDTQQSDSTDIAEALRHDMDLVASLAAAWLKLPPEEEIYEGLADGLRQVIGDDAIITVSRWEPTSGKYFPTVVLGLGPLVEAGTALVGMRPTDISGNYPMAVKQAMATGCLSHLDDGLVGLTGDVIPPAICRHAAALFRLEDVYVLGFAEGGVVGSISIITRRPGMTLRRATIEAMARLAAGAIERVRAQAALRASEEKHRALLEASFDLVFVIGQDDLVRYANPAALRSLGRRESEVIGQLRSSLFPPVIAERQRQSLARVFETGVPYSEQTRVLVNGRPEWQDTQLIPLMSPQGHVDAVLGVTRDITERMRAEALQDSEAQLRAILDTTQFPIAMVDIRNNHIEFWSRSATALFAHAAPTMPEWYQMAFPDPDYRHEAMERWVSSVEEARLSGQTVNAGEYRVTCRDGSVRICELHAAFTGDRLIVTFNDVTRRRQAEEALKSSEGQLRNALQMAHAGHWEYDVARDVFTFNDNFYRIFRTSVEEVGSYEMRSEEYARRFCHADDIPLVGGEIQAALESEDPNYNRQIEHRILYADGEVGHMTVRFFIVKDPGGRTVRTYGVNQDITERKRLEDEKLLSESGARQRQKLESIGTLASGVAHEINNPLSVVLNYGELLLDYSSDPDMVRDFAGNILKEGNRVAVIVRNLLSFSRQDKGTRHPVQVADIVEATLSLVGTFIQKDQIEIVRVIPESLPAVRCRSQQIQQVLLNLLINARDASNERYFVPTREKIIRVTVSTFEKEGACWQRLTVEDQGSGIRPDIADRIFDPFFTTKPRDKGTGLGLSISYGIVAEHHGDIWFETEAGKGTRFHVDLPVDGDEASDRPTASDGHEQTFVP